MLIILSGLKLVNLVNKNSLIWWKQKMGTSTNTRSPLWIQTSSLTSCFWPNVKRDIKQWSSCFWPMDHSWIYTKPIMLNQRWSHPSYALECSQGYLTFGPYTPIAYIFYGLVLNIVDHWEYWRTRVRYGWTSISLTFVVLRNITRQD